MVGSCVVVVVACSVDVVSISDVVVVAAAVVVVVSASVDVLVVVVLSTVAIRPAKTLNSTFDGIFSKLATMLERIAMVQSVRNTRLPTPQFMFIVKFQGQKVKFSQIF